MILTTIVLNLVNLVVLLISIILTPINALITSLVPSVSTALSSVNSFFDLVSGTFTYAVSWTMLSHTALQIVVLYYSFALVFPLSVATLKFVIRWYKTLKP